MQSNYTCISLCLSVCRVRSTQWEMCMPIDICGDPRHCIIWIRFMKWDSLSLGIYLLDLAVISLFELRSEHCRCSPLLLPSIFHTHSHAQANNTMPPNAYPSKTHTEDTWTNKIEMFMECSASVSEADLLPLDIHIEVRNFKKIALTNGTPMIKARRGRWKQNENETAKQPNMGNKNSI